MSRLRSLLWTYNRQRRDGKVFKRQGCVIDLVPEKPCVSVFFFLDYLGVLSVVVIDHGEFQRVVPVRLGALEQILDMNVGVWKRIAAEYDVIDLATSVRFQMALRNVLFKSL
jgi:hypothetical protein